MLEGPIKENSYFFPASQITDYLNGLPESEHCEDQYLGNIEQKIVIMTHDDEFDWQIYEMEKELGFRSTWFLLDSEMNADIPEDIDIQIHFNKETGTLSDQINKFSNKFDIKPKFNRNHRLLWRSNNFDFPFMALNGIMVDSTLIGTRPFQPVIHGRLMPIWELPFCITDGSHRFMASYCVAGNCENPFKQGLSPIVILSHPFSVCQKHELNSCFPDFLNLSLKYDYQVTDIDTFYKEFLVNHS